MIQHYPVLLNEVTENIQFVDGGVYIDCTLGGGGYSLNFIELCLNLEISITLISFDIDITAIENFKDLIKDKYSLNFDKDNCLIIKNIRIFLANENFANIKKVCKRLNLIKVNAIVADLGLNSSQLDNVSGFSYRNLTQELDMRLSKNIEYSASDILKLTEAKVLIDKFRLYSDLEGAEKIVKTIKTHILFLPKDSVLNVSWLLECVDIAIGKHLAVKLDTYAKIFQALRIIVNKEFENLETLLKDSTELLIENGKLLIISFHSGEDRIVKFFGKNMSTILDIVNKDTIIASERELSENRRSKPAKLRIFSKK